MRQIRNPLHFSLLNLALLFAVLISASCASPIPTPPATTPVVVVASSTATVLPTQIPASQTSTTTRTPTSTQTRVPRPTATSLPTKTATPTKYPTLDAQGRMNFVMQALKTNGGCQLPCWWGITPGKTTWKEMVDTFVKEGIGFYQEGQPDLHFVTQDNYQVNAIDVTFQRKNDLVQGIDIRSEYYYLLAQPEHAEAWKNYTFDQVLSQYGVPTQVYLELTVGAGDWSPGMQATYALWLEYANKGIAIRYPGVLIPDNQGWYVCPSFDNAYGSTIKLRTPGSQEPIAVFDADNPFQFGGPLKKLTGTSPHQFYETFKQVPPAQCLLVNDPNPWWYDKLTLPKPSMILPVAQEEEYLINNLASNADCELPCWWGIKPGETTSQSVQKMFLNLGKSVSRQEDGRGLQYRTSLFGRYSPYPFDYTVEHRWFDKNGIVNLFSVTGSALNWSPPQHFAQDWNRYALPEALARYGVPSKVLVHYWSFGWQYNIALFYEDQGFLIAYSGLIGDGSFDYSEKPLRICPAQNRPTEISIWMAEPKSDTLKRLGFNHGEIDPAESYALSLEEVTDVTVQDFYNTFLNPSATTCLTVPREKGESAP
jgi:hypothetical protein